ncbi:MAG: ABC transporter substrate-binding protein [Chloroflexi bacterium]|nr:ABC transporter substrate-binding protein [Chloroflexota bacterium]
MTASPGVAGAAASPSAASPSPAAAAAGAIADLDAGNPGAAAAKAGTPKYGGSIITGQVGDLVTTDGASYSPITNNGIGQVYDELINYGDHLEIQPRLAESWEFSSDNKQIKLNLRQGVLFHDGREFTSDDVKYNMLRVRDPKRNTFAQTAAVGSAWWTNIDTPDKYTIILTSEMPHPGVFDFLQYMRILDPKSIEANEAGDKQSLNGTGPYKFVEWVSGDHISWVKNPNYWQQGVPYIDNFRTNIFRDQQAMISALEAGVIQVVDLAAIPDAVRLQGDNSYNVYYTNMIGQFFHAYFNCSKPPFDNKLVRQAVGYAIDKQRVTDTVFKSFTGPPISLPWTTASPAFDDAKNSHYTFDLDKAKSVLAQAGVSNLTFDLGYATAGYSAEYAAWAQIIQSDLATIGVTVNLVPQDGAVFTQGGTGDPPQFQGMRLSAGAFAQLYEAGSEMAVSRTYGATSNASGFYDDTWKQLTTQVQTEPDPAKRKALYGQINDFILDAAFDLPTTRYPDIVVMKSNVNGLFYETQTDWTIRNTWLS